MTYFAKVLKHEKVQNIELFLCVSIGFSGKSSIYIRETIIVLVLIVTKQGEFQWPFLRFVFAPLHKEAPIGPSNYSGNWKSSTIYLLFKELTENFTSTLLTYYLMFFLPLAMSTCGIPCAEVFSFKPCQIPNFSKHSFCTPPSFQYQKKF